MKIEYDARTDTLTVIFKPGVVAESEEGKPGVILAYDADRNLLTVKVRDASKRVEEPNRMTFTTHS